MKTLVQEGHLDHHGLSRPASPGQTGRGPSKQISQCVNPHNPTPKRMINVQKRGAPTMCMNLWPVTFWCLPLDGETFQPTALAASFRANKRLDLAVRDRHISLRRRDAWDPNKEVPATQFLLWIDGTWGHHKKMRAISLGTKRFKASPHLLAHSCTDSSSETTPVGKIRYFE